MFPEFGHNGTIPKVKYCQPNSHCVVNEKGGRCVGKWVETQDQDVAATAGVDVLTSKGHSRHITQLSHLVTKALAASAMWDSKCENWTHLPTEAQEP